MTIKNKTKKVKGFSLTDECVEHLKRVLSEPDCKFTSASSLIHYLIMSYPLKEQKKKQP